MGVLVRKGFGLGSVEARLIMLDLNKAAVAPLARFVRFKGCVYSLRYFQSHAADLVAATRGGRYGIIGAPQHCG